MGKDQEKPTQVTIACEVPKSLRTFIEQWSKHTGEAKNDIVQSIFSHGLASLCAANDWKPGLVDMVAPILEDLCASSGEDAEILHITLETEAYITRGNGKR